MVHIKTRTKEKKLSNNLPRNNSPFSDLFGDDDPFSNFFGGPRSNVIPEQRASGSGVLISNDGYIVTNNHVVEGAIKDGITVTTSDRKEHPATLVGTDPLTDIAVIKIEAKNASVCSYRLGIYFQEFFWDFHPGEVLRESEKRRCSATSLHGI